MHCKLMCNGLLSFGLHVFDLHLIYLKNGFGFVLILNNFKRRIVMENEIRKKKEDKSREIIMS